MCALEMGVNVGVNASATADERRCTVAGCDARVRGRLARRVLPTRARRRVERVYARFDRADELVVFGVPCTGHRARVVGFKASSKGGHVGASRGFHHGEHPFGRIADDDVTVRVATPRRGKHAVIDAAVGDSISGVFGEERQGGGRGEGNRVQRRTRELAEQRWEAVGVLRRSRSRPDVLHSTYRSIFHRVHAHVDDADEGDDRSCPFQRRRDAERSRRRRRRAQRALVRYHDPQGLARSPETKRDEERRIKV